MDLKARYEFKEYEEALYKRWEDGGYFVAPREAPLYYCIVIPPPNITGELHMGHALNNAIQDILIRYHRMLGRGTLWIPGTDHASIATENVVERQLAKEGIEKRRLGREEFIKRVWQWKELYGGIIVKQLRRLGVSCDWSRERFTMDEQLSEAVREAFVRLFEEGLIYRGEYLVNWCPRCKTALSDDEVEHIEEGGKFWFLRYPYAEGGGYIEVATTRPETMLGDTAVAVNPEDERYRSVIGREVVLPLIGRRIPVIADDAVQKEFGTGAVKITPAHDFNDFEIAKKHNLMFVNIMNPDGTLNENAGAYKGLDRYEARKRVVEDLQTQGLLGKIEEHSLALGRCYRCNTPIEPYLSRQWFVKMRPLAAPAIKAVKQKKMRFFPERWKEYYLSWLENVRDWCISRQLWWGHRIPVFYCDECENVFADAGAPQRCPKCESERIRQDEDVLDTWFSSALWPFSTMGWPNYKTEDKKGLIERFFPTNVLVTDRGIIFFWVARMAMTSLHFLKNVPFKDVYIHGTILDELGRKMSKSLGNGIDPVEMIEIYGADAVRFSLMMLTVEGQDVRLSQSKFEMGRNFVNKLWNAMRFVLSNLKPIKSERLDRRKMALEDRWILSRLTRLLRGFKGLMKDYRLNEALRSVYEFFWHEFCEWYLELIKPRLKGTGGEKDIAQIVMFI
ncbi:MAG: valine--tRNA ligase, partial [Planctomycetota bacterium]|nr:valine--tRNA ligase [Planctomycetota bacterium]